MLWALGGTDLGSDIDGGDVGYVGNSDGGDDYRGEGKDRVEDDVATTTRAVTTATTKVPRQSGGEQSVLSSSNSSTPVRRRGRPRMPRG